MRDALLIIESLMKMGYRIWVEKGILRLSFRGQVKPDTSEVKRLTNQLKRHKAEALAYLAPFIENAETPAAAPGPAVLPCRLCPAFWPAWKSEDFDGWCLYHRDGVNEDTPVCRQFREARVTEDTLEYPYCPQCGGVVFAPNHQGKSVCFRCVWKPWMATKKSTVRKDRKQSQEESSLLPARPNPGREPRQRPNSERNDRLDDYPEEDSLIYVREPQKVEVGH